MHMQSVIHAFTTLDVKSRACSGTMLHVEGVAVPHGTHHVWPNKKHHNLQAVHLLASYFGAYSAPPPFGACSLMPDTKCYNLNPSVTCSIDLLQLETLDLGVNVLTGVLPVSWRNLTEVNAHCKTK